MLCSGRKMQWPGATRMKGFRVVCVSRMLAATLPQAEHGALMS